MATQQWQRGWTRRVFLSRVGQGPGSAQDAHAMSRRADPDVLQDLVQHDQPPSTGLAAGLSALTGTHSSAT